MNNRNRLLALLLALVMSLSLAACDGDAESSAPGGASSAVSPEATNSPGTSPSPSGSPDESAAPDASASAEVLEIHSQRRDVTRVDFGTIASLSNADIPYGFNNSDRDALNRPNGLYYYERLYGKYAADYYVDTEDKLIYLTMDEGYENGCTPSILKTLREKGVRATFFVTKQFVDEHPELVRQMIDEGHTVGSHSCSHPSGGLPQLGAQGVYEDMKRLNDMVYEQFNYQMDLFRYPEGVSSEQSLALIEQMGYTSVFWSFAYRDYVTDDQMDPATALNQCMNYIHPGAIYLLHAVSTTNTEILGDFIDSARAQGYEFGSPSDLVK